MRFERLVFVPATLAVAIAATSFAQVPDRCSNATQPTSMTAKSANRRPLTVVLYPVIPEFTRELYAIKKGFESQHPEVDLCLIDLRANYYNPAKPDYIETTPADVYELDSVFLQDFVDHGWIQELPTELQLPRDQLLKNALNGSTANGKRYGAPHWVCSNFLFFRKDDAPLRSVHTLANLERVLTMVNRPPGQGLLTDLKGGLTLGEFYLQTAVDQYMWPSAWDHLSTVEPDLEKRLERLRALCDPEYCRDDDYHNTEVYGRSFARGKGRALLGYSESLHQVLGETMQGCTKSDHCLQDSDLDVTALSTGDSATMPTSWVDSLVLSSKCIDDCRADAIAFVQYLLQDDTYKSILQPDKYAVPTYLLPAKASLYSNPDIIVPAHLYPKLRAIIEAAVAPTHTSLNQTLRADGNQIDGLLPK